VEAVPSGGALLHQMSTDQHVELLPRLRRRDADQRCGGGQAEVISRMHPEESEEARLRLGKRAVRPGEDRAHRVGLSVVLRTQGIPERGLVA
jgi:hypothetical protein